MATLAPGVLLNLLNRMNTDTNPTSEHRNSLLQVTDIVPADLDEKNLWPKHGFYIKVSDSTHSIYVSLPSDQDDFVLSNKMQLGQLVHVDRLEPGSPVPILKGAKPLPGRHPLVGMTESLLGLREKEDKSEKKPYSMLTRRGSWGIEQNSILKPIPFNFAECTPVKTRPSYLKPISPLVGKKGKDVRGSAGLRRSHTGGLMTRMANIKGENLALLRKSCAIPTVSNSCPRSRSVLNCEARNAISSPFPSFRKRSSTPPATLNSPRKSIFEKRRDEVTNCHAKSLSGLQSDYEINASSDDDSNPPMILPGRLGAIGKVVVWQRDMARKQALKALRNASATATLVRSLKSFSNLIKLARPDAPTGCFNQFLDFYCQIAQAVSDMMSIRTVGSASETQIIKLFNPKDKEPLEELPILRKAGKNSVDQSRDGLSSSQRTITIKLSGNYGKVMRPNELQKVNSERKEMNNAIFWKPPVEDSRENVENEKPECCSLSGTIKLGKKIETESGIWFMDFLDKVLETGSNKQKANANDVDTKKIPQSLLLRIVNWVEIEQVDCSKRPIHPKAAQIARKLRIKMKSGQ